MVAKHYGKTLSIQKLRQLSQTTREGSSLFDLSEAAEKIGFHTLGVRLSLEKLSEASFPCVLHWNNEHYVVLYKIKSDTYHIADPAFGLLTYTKEEFLQHWIGENASEITQEGIILLLEPTASFYEEADDKETKTYGFYLIYNHLWKHKAFVWQLVISLLTGSLLQLIFPFLTQSIVDVGIQNQDIHFIYLILMAQLFLFFGRTALEFIRSWILLHLSTRINISLLSDFFIKLMNLPIAFFDVRMTGDIMQRINDHSRIERFLTTSSLSVIFSVFNIFIMGGVLAYYNLKIFAIFFIASFLYFLWIVLFLKKREKLDYKRFSAMSDEQSKVIELINGMQEIKLQNAERQKRWSWEFLQARLFRVSVKGLGLEQTQNIGSSFINELKNIFIIFLSAKLVVEGQMTLGMMMAVSSIVGSLNSPIVQLIAFIREFQDAKISLTRLLEIHEKEDENTQIQSLPIPENAEIELRNVSFSYVGSDKKALDNISLIIPANKTTAIVGASGSGKTTLMKLLLKFYEPINGNIYLSNDSQKNDLQHISQKDWRNHIGAVMQEGYIFNDTIAGNIAVGIDNVDLKRLLYATETANIQGFIKELPLGFNTKIGMEGVGMSTGQKQRIFIARAVYN